METFIFHVTGPLWGEFTVFPSQRPVTRSFDVFFDLRLNRRLSKPSRRRWFETPSRSLWDQCNVYLCCVSARAVKTTTCVPGVVVSWQLPLQPIMKILSKWHFRSSVVIIFSQACLFVPGRFSLHVPEDPQDPAGPQNSEEPRGRGFQNFEDAPDLPGPENLEAHQDVSGSPEQDPQSPDETQDLNSSTKQGLENQRENQDLSDSLVNKGWAEPEGPASCGELGGGEDCVDYNLADDEVLLGFDNGDGPACGSNEYLEAGECVQCPVCGIGQKLSEVSGVYGVSILGSVLVQVFPFGCQQYEPSASVWPPTEYIMYFIYRCCVPIKVWCSLFSVGNKVITSLKITLSHMKNWRAKHGAWYIRNIIPNQRCPKKLKKSKPI